MMIKKIIADNMWNTFKYNILNKSKKLNINYNIIEYRPLRRPLLDFYNEYIVLKSKNKYNISDNN